MQNKLSGPSIKRETKIQQITIALHKTTGVYSKTSLHEGQLSCQTITVPHKDNRVGTHCITTLLCNTTHPMPPDGCKTLQS